MQHNKKKILIIGNGGSGKTSLAVKLSSLLKYPVLHLDSIYWVDGWKKNSLEDFEKITHQFMQSNSWIIEGTPMHDIQFRIKQADLVIFLDIKRAICILRLLKRSIKNIFYYHNSDEKKSPATFFNLKAATWVWRFDQSKRNEILDLLNKENNRNVLHISSNKELKNFFSCYYP